MMNIFWKLWKSSTTARKIHSDLTSVSVRGITSDIIYDPFDPHIVSPMSAPQLFDIDKMSPTIYKDLVIEALNWTYDVVPITTYCRHLPEGYLARRKCAVDLRFSIKDPKWPGIYAPDDPFLPDALVKYANLGDDGFGIGPVLQPKRFGLVIKRITISGWFLVLDENSQMRVTGDVMMEKV